MVKNVSRVLVNGGGHLFARLVPVGLFYVTLGENTLHHIIMRDACSTVVHTHSLYNSKSELGERQTLGDGCIHVGSSTVTKAPLCWGMWMMEEATHVWGEGIWQILYLPLKLAMNLKPLLKLSFWSPHCGTTGCTFEPWPSTVG